MLEALAPAPYSRRRHSQSPDRDPAAESAQQCASDPTDFLHDLDRVAERIRADRERSAHGRALVVLIGLRCAARRNEGVQRADATTFRGLLQPPLATRYDVHSDHPQA